MKLIDEILYETIKNKKFDSQNNNNKVKLLKMCFLLGLDEGDNILKCQIKFINLQNKCLNFNNFFTLIYMKYLNKFVSIK